MTKTYKKGDPVTLYKYNQRKVYGSLTAGGSYVELTAYGSPATIQVDDPQGTLLEYTGSEGYLFFKATYYNSTTTTETDIADATETSGDESARYTSIYLIRKKAGIIDNPFLTDAYVEAKRTEAESEVNAYLSKRYTLPLSVVPKLIQNITTTLAAGYIHDDEMGEEGFGPQWIDRAQKKLSMLSKGSLELIDTGTSEELARNGDLGKMTGYPDTDTPSSEGAIFSITDRF